ncbi:MAG TPA: TetR family transcriptional regulator [Solirubrobacteraceae bacterium]|jgi:AcrR family transcriptional regulator/DNA-binding MarR family transcriptional regulator|nr:TetR family transcriptional regulator [Solirubrobacteraceae bacterium]
MPAVAEQRRRGDARVSRRGQGSSSRREGAAGVSEVQRARMLISAARVVSEHGYQKMSVARVTGGARVSRRTFYDVFEDREDCFLAIFEDALERAGARVSGAYERAGAGRSDWRERVRRALGELLVFFDEEPRVASLLVVDALGAGPRVLERRAQVLKGLGVRLHTDGSRAAGAKEIAPLTGEGVVGAVFGVIHTRLSQKERAGTLELLNPLMAMIVLPYLGQAVARKELRGTRTFPSDRKEPAGLKGPTRLAEPPEDPLAGLPMRITYRTLRVLGAIAENPGASNRIVGEGADTYDQGQVSKLLARLERLGLIENTSGNDHRPTGEPNAWRLTARGEEIERALRVGVDELRDGEKPRRTRR